MHRKLFVAVLAIAIGATGASSCGGRGGSPPTVAATPDAAAFPDGWYMYAAVPQVSADPTELLAEGERLARRLRDIGFDRAAPKRFDGRGEQCSSIREPDGTETVGCAVHLPTVAVVVLDGPFADAPPGPPPHGRGMDRAVVDSYGRWVDGKVAAKRRQVDAAALEAIAQWGVSYFEFATQEQRRATGHAVGHEH